MAESYTNIRVILDKILRNPLLQDLNLELAIDYTIDFMRMVGVPSIFENKVDILTLESNRVKLPDDFYQMIQVRLNKTKEAFRYTTDSFHMSLEDKSKQHTIQDLTYKIQGGVLFSSLKDGDIEISYEAIPIDEDNLPLIPDNTSFTKALEWYIKKEWYTILYEQGKISRDILQHTEREYAWCVGDCQTEFNRLSLDKAESLYNSWKTLMLRDNEHKSGFMNMGTKELIRVK